jgi:hypothetical protein
MISGFPLFVCALILTISISLLYILIKGLLPLDRSLINILSYLRQLERNAGADPRTSEKIRELFEKEGSLYHHWQEYYESIAVKHFKEDSLLSATEPASNYFNFDNLVHTAKWNKFIKFEVFTVVPSVLTGLGLLGTFAGLVKGLPSGVTIDKIMDDIAPFLREMSGAFIASFLGVFCSLVFNIIEKMQREKVQSHCNELSNHIDRIFPRQTEFELLSDIRGYSDQQLAQFKSLAIDIGNEVARGIVGNATANIQIDEGVKQGIAKGFGILAESLQSFVQVQKGFAEEMVQLQVIQKEIASTFQVIQTSSKATVEQVQTASNAIGLASGILSQVSERFPLIVQQINTTVDAQASSTQILGRTSEAILGTTSTLINQQNEMQKTFDNTISNFKNVNNEFSEKVSNYHKQQNESLSRSLNSFDKAMAEAVEKLGSGVGSLNILMNQMVENLEEIKKSNSR